MTSTDLVGFSGFLPSKVSLKVSHRIKIFPRKNPKILQIRNMYLLILLLRRLNFCSPKSVVLDVYNTLLLLRGDLLMNPIVTRAAKYCFSPWIS